MHGILVAVLKDGVSFGGIVRSIPHDPAAFMLYLMLAGAVWLIWKGSRAGSAPSDGPTP